ncbi:MAG: iron ABC transporter permease [Spirochaetota bacterium]
MGGNASMKAIRSFALSITILSILLIGVVIVSICIGTVTFPPGKVFKALGSRLPFLSQSIQVDPSTATIVWDLRLARALLAASVGSALAVSGAAFQGLFRNPLADPFVIGASSGAALGATIAIVLNLQAGYLGLRPIPFTAFLGALAAVAAVYLISQTGRQAPPAVALLLAGTALGSLMSSIVSLIMSLNARELHQIFFWLLGGFGGRSWSELISLLPYLLLSFIILGLVSRPLDIMAFGEEAAQGMGLSVRHSRLMIVIAASLATAAAVANTGIIGFVGLLAPHTARLLFGYIHRRLIPASALLGAILLVLADDLARTILQPQELPVGVLTALLGAPFFLYLLRSRRERLGGD